MNTSRYRISLISITRKNIITFFPVRSIVACAGYLTLFVHVLGRKRAPASKARVKFTLCVYGDKCELLLLLLLDAR